MSFSVAMLSIHTSPLAMPGQTKDAGGMNVYMRKLAEELPRDPADEGRRQEDRRQNERYA